MTTFQRLALLGIAALLGGCASSPMPPPARPATDVAPGSRGPVQGVGIEGRDIVAMTNQMARDLLNTPRVVGSGGQAPRVIIDGQYFKVEGSQPINRNVITQRLMVELNRASSGRLVFVGRRHSDMVAQEREAKREGTVDRATNRMTKAQMGADYRLAGTFTTLDSMQSRTGMQQRYNQLVFELVDLESGEIVWSNLYEVERAAADDVVYR